MEDIKINQLSNVSECIWSQSLKTWTVVFSIILIAIFIGVVRVIYNGNGTIPHYVVAVIVFLAFCFSLAFSPQYVAVNANGLRIKLMGGSIKVPIEKIDHVEKYSHLGSEYRIFGIGQMFGNIGYYRSKSLGSFIAYVTDWSKSYVIYRKKGKPIVVSVEDESVFQPFMKNGSEEK